MDEEKADWAAAQAEGGIWKEGQAPLRGPCRAKLRNHLALWHGLGAKYLPELESMEGQGIQLSGLEREMVRWRVVVRRAAILSGEAETPSASLRTSLKEGMELLEAGGTVAVRLGKVLKYMHKSKEAATKAEWEEAVDEALEKVLEEEWPKWVSEVRSMGLSCTANAASKSPNTASVRANLEGSRCTVSLSMLVNTSPSSAPMIRTRPARITTMSEEMISLEAVSKTALAAGLSESAARGQLWEARFSALANSVNIEAAPPRISSCCSAVRSAVIYKTHASRTAFQSRPVMLYSLYSSANRFASEGDPVVELNKSMQAALHEAQSDPVGTMRRIMDNEPALTIYGYDDTSDPVLVKRGRHELLEAAEDKFAMSSEWFSHQQALDTPIGGIYSHFLKHEITDYASSKLGHQMQIQEGMVIASALQMGYPVDDTCGGGALIGIHWPKSDQL